jgi:hypothetical protein
MVNADLDVKLAAVSVLPDLWKRLGRVQDDRVLQTQKGIIEASKFLHEAKVP